MRGFVHAVLLALVCLAGGAAAQRYDPSAYCQANTSFPATQAPAGLRLALVQLLIRHGDRTPVYSLPAALDNAEWRCTLNMLEGDSDGPSREAALSRVWQKVYDAGANALPGNCMKGQLTEKGAAEHRALGSALRAAYVGSLLPAKLDASLFHFRSTDVPRTIQSCYNVMQTMYPPQWRNATERLTLHTMDKDLDDLSGPNSNICPALGRAIKRLESASNYTEYYEAKLAPLAAKYSALWGIPVDAHMFHALNDVLRARFCHALPYPPDMSEADAETIMSAASHLTNLVLQPKFMLQYAQTRVFATYLENFKRAQVGGKVRFVFNSAHDSTVRPFLMALGAFDGAWPPYASNVALEMYEDKQGAYYVALKYNGALKLMSTCSSVFCPWQTFQELMSSFIIPDEQCQ